MLQRFFILCSGADRERLQSCSNGEQNKYAGIGATVFFTAVMAWIAASYALYTVFDNAYIAVFFGLVWGLLIFNLDRFIVSTLRKREDRRNEFLQAVPRLLLALIIAIVIAKPLELKIFEKEIDQVLLEEKNQMTLNNKQQIAQLFGPDIEAKQQEIDQLKRELTVKEMGVDSLYEIYISEAEGRKGTRLLGKGPVYKEKREKHDAALAELKTMKGTYGQKMASLEQEIQQLKTAQSQQESSTQPIISNVDGLMARIEALDQLPWLPSFFIFLLFLAIETAPIFAKLVAPKGEYDYKLAAEEEGIKQWVAQQIDQQQQLFQTDVALNQKVYQELKEEEALYQYKRKKGRELMQLQTDAFYKRQKKFI